MAFPWVVRSVAPASGASGARVHWHCFLLLYLCCNAASTQYLEARRLASRSFSGVIATVPRAQLRVRRRLCQKNQDNADWRAVPCGFVYVYFIMGGLYSRSAVSSRLFPSRPFFRASTAQHHHVRSSLQTLRVKAS